MEFDAAQIKVDLINWLQHIFATNGPSCKAVIGISGGKDSTIAAALCVEALGKERVFGVLMPNGSQHDIEYSYEIVKHWISPIMKLTSKILITISSRK